MERSQAQGTLTAEVARRHGIVALDGSLETTRRLVRDLSDWVGYYKVGLELFTAAGPAAVEELRGAGKRVFLDLKLHDIPNTVAGAARHAAGLGVDLLTVHAGGGTEMIRAAVDAAEGRLTVVAVTVLTSLSEERLPAHFRRDQSLADTVLALTEEALAAGARGVVLSGAELSAVKARFGARCLCVVPGVRAAGGAAHDQSRVVTPRSALSAGADYLVIGRAVTGATDPVRGWADLWQLEGPA